MVTTLSPGKKAPHIVDVVIEITPEQGPVKYEICKDAGALRVDRIISTAMHYPGLYGYIPSTLCDDGDPCDVLILCHEKILPGTIMAARPVGMLVMEDEAGLDNKIIAVPDASVSKSYEHIQDLSDISQAIQDKIAHFFAHYKDLDKNKWVKVSGWENAKSAKAEIEKSISAVSE